MTQIIEQTMKPQVVWFTIGRWHILKSGPESRAWYNAWTDKITIDANYSADEKKIILAHEMQHAKDRPLCLIQALFGMVAAALFVILLGLALLVNNLHLIVMPYPLLPIELMFGAVLLGLVSQMFYRFLQGRADKIGSTHDVHGL